MPDPTTADDPKTEPLDLRLLRDILTEHGTPLTCRRRQCRRNRHCSGEAQRTDQPLASGESLPPCVAHAKPRERQEIQTLAGGLRPHVSPSTEPRKWPEDKEAVSQFRLALAMIHRIHTRPGLHPEHERAALADWQATDPDPEASALYRRTWHHGKPDKRPSASPSTAA
ncbi:hypothetical protein FVA81_04765 [Rhizobium sp. WL3]|uniref:hypothetical protein n=1 Tax=Rhizobium sp. WL3 TaxID=2603277 RepID=UPI0011C1D6CB|nr:hypothetical protein [Rhizobium sp. WL3]QEE43966.1 hypothetical protein FVA81_04765 [Rhizobium sp. WL3]